MENILFDFSKTSGIIKPMNAVNNGPTTPGVRKVRTNFEAYKAARIPFARNHDASFYAPYGGEHIVDVHRIFKNFDADENDPESYIFEPTDDYVKNTHDAGTKTFYRLGASIEHYYKYGTRVPKDYGKWARICEHIIRHYTEGWANGFHYDIEYWEIWNEPDCLNGDGSNPCWQGTWEQFIDLYEVAAKHLKKCFPHLKIGGPAFATPEPYEFKDLFLKAVKERNIPLDFYSFHRYAKRVEDFEASIYAAVKNLEEIGVHPKELILNEWNYVRGWVEDIWYYSLDTEKNLKGASFVAGVMCVSQASPLDMLMYYDARPCAMNGMFDSNTFEPLKPYYPFYIFSDLKEMGSYVKPYGNAKNIYSCGAKGDKSSGIMLTYFSDNDDGYWKDEPIAEKSKEITLNIVNPYPGKKVKVTLSVTDNEYNNAPIRGEEFSSDTFEVKLVAELYSVYYINIQEA